SLAITLLHLAAIFQISDALQVALSGALRGYKDTQIIMPITLFSYWIVGMGLGYVLSLTDLIVPAMGVAGFWYGLIAGLSMAAVLLGWRFIVTNQQRAATV
ncbi:MAG: MATE family efflux transporter, partial [Oceanospirillum sp.]|nr:MATE family efflux transporter [Oceanospirillum sp.]